MDASRWELVQTLFHEALTRPQNSRVSYLETACEGDPELLAEVLEMLAEDAAARSLLDRPLSKIAGNVLGSAGPSFQEIGHYRVLRILGKGGMGVVYLGEHRDLRRRAAIKVLPDASLSPARRHRFEREEQMLAQLTHPSIARLYEAAVLPDGTPYFVMEYVDGISITQYCARHHCGIPERLKLFRQVCGAVQYAHGRAVIHRDLKPSNILVTEEGTVRLLDFGIAKQIADLDTPDIHTRTGLRLMTPAYAAPEQLRGERPGVYTDVYGLGVVLYELLTGQLPFDLSGLTPGQSEVLILEQQPERPSERVRLQERGPKGLFNETRRAWSDLDVLCLTAMHNDPRRRYPTVESLMRDLDHYRHGEPLEARPDSVAYRMGKFMRRNRVGVVSTALVAVLLFGLTAYYTHQLAASRDEALAEAARTQRIQQFVLNLFEGGDEMAGPADTLRVVTLIDRGVREAAVLDAEPDIQADLFLTLGGIYQQLGRFDRSDSLMQMSLKQRTRHFGPDHPDVAESMVALGLLRSDQADFDEAERLVRNGLKITSGYYPATHPAVLRARHALGKVLQTKGDYGEAIAVLTEAERVQSPGDAPTTERALILSELANTHFYAGNYDISDSLNHVLLAMSRELYGERHPYVADDLVNLGAVQFQRGYFVEAEQYYREALDIFRGYFGAEHHRTASNLTMLGRALVFQERYEEGQEILEHSLAIQERVYGSSHPRVASVLNELGTVAYSRGDNARAEVYYRRMAAIYDEVYDEPHYLMGIAQSNLASVYLGEGHYQRAEESMRAVIELFTETLSAEHLDTGIAHIKLGRILKLQDRPTEAESELLSGYAILSDQTSPSISWLRIAREDLIDIYEAIGRPEDAQRFRAEMEAVAAQSS